MIKLLLANGGRGMIFYIHVIFTDFYIIQCKIDCSIKNFTSLKHGTWLWKIHQVPKSGLTVQKGPIDKLSFLL